MIDRIILPTALGLGLSLALGAGGLSAMEPAPAQQQPGRQLQVPEPQDVAPEAQGWNKVTLIEGLEHPWGLAFLPDGQMLITERPGRLRLARNNQLVEQEIDGVPDVLAQGQGGLLDVSIHPNFAQNQFVYLTYAAGTEEENRTTVARGRLDIQGMALRDVEVIFEVEPVKSDTQHYGSRILWLPDGTMLVSIGDGGNPPLEIDGTLAREHGQRLDSHLASIVRLNDDGSVPRDNPFVGREDAKDEIYSYGHRNIQGMALDPQTGNVWANEHGPRGGDELNLVQKGRNHGWPEATFGADYRTGDRFAEHRIHPEGVAPKVVWTPAQAPSGLTFYTGDRFPDWQGDLFSGGLVGEQIRRIRLNGESVLGQESIPIGRRVRDVVQGPDGLLYVLTDHEDGELIRIEPE